jgi:hypothetical protein
MWLSGNWRASSVVSVSSKTRLAQPIQSSLQYGTVVAVCPASLYTCQCHWSSFHKSAHYLTFHNSQLIISHSTTVSSLIRIPPYSARARTFHYFAPALTDLDTQLITPHSPTVSSLSHIPRQSAHYLTFPRDTWVSECLSWTAVMTVSLALWVLQLSNFSAWNKL